MKQLYFKIKLHRLTELVRPEERIEPPTAAAGCHGAMWMRAATFLWQWILRVVENYFLQFAITVYICILKHEKPA